MTVTFTCGLFLKMSNRNDVARKFYAYCQSHLLKGCIEEIGENDIQRYWRFTFTMNGSTVAIDCPDTMQWAAIERGLESRRLTDSRECGICLEKLQNPSGCDKCGHDWCYECAMNIMWENYSAMVCPYCRHSMGTNYGSFNFHCVVAMTVRQAGLLQFKFFVDKTGKYPIHTITNHDGHETVIYPFMMERYDAAENKIKVWLPCPQGVMIKDRSQVEIKTDKFGAVFVLSK